MRGNVCGGSFLLLLPPLRHRQSSAVECAAAEPAAGRGLGGSGVRRAHGYVLHGLPAGPAGLLLLQLWL